MDVVARIRLAFRVIIYLQKKYMYSQYRAADVLPTALAYFAHNNTVSTTEE